MFVCEVCTYPSLKPDRCDNPGCLANPSANHAALREIEARHQADIAEREQRNAFRKRLQSSGFKTGF